jgi:colanic acid/amylovoran biosynthesis glycosyltransferase
MTRPEQRDERGPGVVAYVTGRYPAISHTFILREVEALRAAGLLVQTFSVHRAKRSTLLCEADRQAFTTTEALLPASPAAIASAHLHALLRSPRDYLRTLAHALRMAQPGIRGRIWGAFYFAEAILFWESASRLGVDHVHAQFASSASDIAMLAAMYNGAHRTGPRSWSIAVHGPVEFYDVTRFRLREKLADCAFAVAVSDFGRSQLMTLAPEERWDRLVVVPCGVNPSEYTSRDGDGNDRWFNLLSVGRLVELKGHPVLLAAVAELTRRGVDVRLVLVGEGPLRPRLTTLAAELGIADRVELRGAVAHDALPSCYASADAFCLASFAEGLPVVLMEAMAGGLPVVSTQVMGIPELVEDGLSGLLVAPGRADLLADALERLARDPALRRDMGQRGRARVLERHDVAVSAEALLAKFRSALSCDRASVREC